MLVRDLTDFFGEPSRDFDLWRLDGVPSRSLSFFDGVPGREPRGDFLPSRLTEGLRRPSEGAASSCWKLRERFAFVSPRNQVSTFVRLNEAAM